jgi:hypothetical protein
MKIFILHKDNGEYQGWAEIEEIELKRWVELIQKR